MREEFHGIDHGGGTYTYKQLYNWNSVNANVWLPSLSELVSTTGNQADTTGCYDAAMQGFNISIIKEGKQVDIKGGEQFTYFKQYNSGGGGEAIMNACKQEITWLRSTSPYNTISAWYTNLSEDRFDWRSVTGFRAVHPVGDTASKSHFGYTLLYEIKRYREKLGTKAVQEEFHGDGTGKYQILYHWKTLNVNVWLPSLSELAGIDSAHYSDLRGTYIPAMQGLDISSKYYTDAQGGNQFAYFQHYNTSGGGEKIWNVCNHESTWTRSSVHWETVTAWRITNATAFSNTSATASHAVHLFVVEGHIGSKLVLLFLDFPNTLSLRNKDIPREAGDEGRARGVSWGGVERWNRSL